MPGVLGNEGTSLLSEDRSGPCYLGEESSGANGSASPVVPASQFKSATRLNAKLDRFFAELKRRNVYKVAIAYGVVAWLLIQIATQVFPFFDIPNWAVRLVVLLPVIGFPVALFIAWAFEATPEGIKSTEAADAAGKHSRGRVWAYIVLIGAVLSVALFVFERYSATRKHTNLVEFPANSIAVLPFVDFSQTHDQEYFCDGISEEILDALAKIHGLRVIARTSSFSFQGKNIDVTEIAQKLNVRNILEGSMRREGNRIRVSAQLVSATDGSHLWSETYECELKSVFAVQDQIALAIVDALTIKLVLPSSADAP